MDRDMRLRKVCPQCNTVVHMKRSCCGCGHVFTLKRKVQVSADKSMGKAVKRRRALETVEDTLRRQAQNRTHMAERDGSSSAAASIAIFSLFSETSGKATQRNRPEESENTTH